MQCRLQPKVGRHDNDVLVASGLDCATVRPAGFFSDMLEFLDMARRGRVNLASTGECRINPIRGRDLAKLCVAALTKPADRRPSLTGKSRNWPSTHCSAK